ncbi:MAG: YciI family protein [Chloroflexota bacterium]|nr:YciI family protein [Chloroflexota bacterium]
MKYVLFYDSTEDILSKAAPHIAAHSARLRDFHARGTLLMGGAFANVQDDGAMIIFTTRDAAEEFVQGDPYLLHGVIRAWHIRAWNEGVA